MKSHTTPGIRTVMEYRFFIAGIIQGSKKGLETHNQDYRQAIKTILREAFPDANILCPVENHPESVSYTDERARDVFLHHVARARSSHVLVAYLPEASMGSAIELWEAFREKTLKIAISPMSGNWVIRILSDRILPDLAAFRRFVGSGEMKTLLEARFNSEAGENA
jgi:hypothetical protein